MAGAGVFPKVQGDIIYADDFNTIKNVVQGVYATAYGQTSSVSAVAQNDDILVSSWDQLRTELDKCYKHITGSLSGVQDFTTADVVEHSSVNLYKTRADYCETNKYTVYAATQLSYMSNVNTSTRPGTGWNNYIRYDVRVRFDSAAQAGHFFNAGGYFTLNVTASGGTGGTKNTNWASAINSAPTFTYNRTDYNTYTSGQTKQATRINVAGPYSLSFIDLECLKESSTSLMFSILLSDVSSFGNPDELIDLTITGALGYYKSVDAIVPFEPYDIVTNTPFTNTP